jgi:hypothetical protein
MRSTSLLMMLSVAACSKVDDGTLLNIDTAGGGPESAARVEILLANAKDTAITEVDDQRVRAGDLAQEGVRYYRQRASAGEVENVAPMNGFRVRIEPNEELVAEKDLVPFLVAYDANEQIIGIGSYVDANGQPDKIEIRDDLLRVYDITMVAMTQVTSDAGVETGMVLPVECGNFRSGLAFQPGDTELRLLLPDRSQDRLTDATERALDMDCDGVLADRGDCDDLRGEFHPGAIEACDGMDHDCDFRRLELVPCNGIATTCGETEGVQLCADTVQGGAVAGACTAEPVCECANGTCGSFCLLGFQSIDGVAAKTMCDPQIDAGVAIPGCGALCTVEVVERPGDEFRVTIALENDPNFTVKLHDVPAKIQIKVEHVGPNPVTGDPATGVGGFFLAVLPNGSSQVISIPVGLVLEAQGQTCNPGSPRSMNCGFDQ